MSLLGFDGFTAYSVPGDMVNRWTRGGDQANAAINLSGGQNERGGLRLGLNDRTYDEFYWNLVSLKTNITVGFWLKLEDFDSTNSLYDMVLKLNSTTSTRLSMRIYQDGSVRFHRLTNSTLLFDSADTADTFDGTQKYLSYGSEYKIELRVNMVNSTGTLEFRVNDEIWFLGEGNVDLDGTVNRIYFVTGEEGSGLSYEVSDFWITEADGTSPETFLGAGFQVEVQRPTAESATIAFTPDTGTDNSAMVDDAPRHDADATANESTSNAQVDRYTSTATVAGQRVLGVNVVNVARHLGTAQNMRAVIFENATAGNGSDVALTAEFLPYHELFTQNPDTVAEWTPAEVDAAEFGLESRA